MPEGEENALKRYWAEFEYLRKTYEEFMQADYYDLTQQYARRCVAVLRKIVGIDPDNADSWVKIGEIYSLLADFKSAADAYKNALNLKHTDLTILKMLGESYLNLSADVRFPLKSEYEEKAAEHLSRYVAEFPSDHYALISLANAHKYLGDFDRAEECYRKALELAPEDHRVLRTVASFYTKIGNFERAIELLRKDCELEPKTHHPWTEMGRIYQEMGDLEKAIECTLEALKRLPDSFGLLQDLESYYAQLGEYEKAAECRAKAISRLYERKRRAERGY